jgi:hypothetical protein
MQSSKDRSNGRFLQSTILLGALLLLVPSCKQGGSQDVAGLVITAAPQPTSNASSGKTKESEKLREYQQYARRLGSTLELRLASGDALKLEDQPVGPSVDVEKVVKYEFSGYLKQIDHFLVSSAFYEGSVYLLVSRKSGKRFVIDNVPILSPNSDRFVTVSICDSGCPYRVQIWRVTEAELQPEWTFKPEQYWASGRAKWLDASTIEVVSEIADPVKSDPSKGKYLWMQKTMYLRLVSDAWSFGEKRD